MTTAPEPTVGDLLEGILADVRRLLGQQVDLFKQELQTEIGRAGAAAASAGAGAGLVALSGVLGAHTVVHLLHERTRLPLWACYGLATGLLGAAGVGLLAYARQRAAGVHVAPTATAEAVKENVTWLLEQATGRPA